ncbi:hypothetical protein CDD82_6527 [Ophiocordyceps australis]|uniref:Succinate dehydrogenase assembly factor 4, mitochondrial n=1 Tax=Ophiocordyceps australis TaxID=1399860 RepID=A0A2C5YUI2_9HYPO|nr:hypothetical protein CDD82_6527 [Ophiocordyceps australis]
MRHHHDLCITIETMPRLSARSFLRPRLPWLCPRARRPSSTFAPKPSPPKLPADQQAEFERLQRLAAASPPPPAFDQSTSAAPPSGHQPSRTTTNVVSDVNQPIRRGAPPEFSGHVNPKTGEVDGPKNDPLRWGGESDWSYNGRTTDF